MLEDPCKNPVIQVPDVTTLTYVITDNEVKYTLEPKYSVTPDFCPFEITVNVNGIDVTFDPDTQEIVVEQITDDLTPSNPNDDGSTEHTYDIETTIEVTAEDGSTTTDSTTMPVVVKNPCVDPKYVTIEVAVFDDLDYNIQVGPVPVTYNPHAVFLVKTKPVDHNLCGSLVYEPRYNGQALTGQVLTYVSATRKFTVSTDDDTLSGNIVPYSVIATLVNYPADQYASAPSVENGANILFNDPCRTPVSLFESTQLDSTKSDKYSGVPVVFQSTRFDIDPPQCRVTYECTSVTYDDNQSSVIDCSDFTFDGDFNGDNTDGQLSITVTSDKFIDTNNSYPVGDYFILITGTAVDSQDQLPQETTVKLTLVNPCDPPNSLTAPTLMNRKYTISDANAPSYTTGDFVIEPAFCEYSVEYSITDLTSVEAGAPTSAITVSGASGTSNNYELSFLYNFELPDLTQK